MDLNLKKKIEKNFERLSEPLYQIQNIFQRQSYEWYGDWEGRALLSFVCQFKLTGKKIPCMDLMFGRLPEKTNGYLYFGKPYDGKVADEQQLSGHSWYLRALVAYAGAFGSAEALEIARSTVENLYLPVADKYENYPVERDGGQTGGVGGNAYKVQDGWKLSTDVGCAFMPIDGLVQMGTAVNSAIDSLTTFVLFAVAPFNLLKGVLVSLIVFLIYKKISPVFKMNH